MEKALFKILQPQHLLEGGGFPVTRPFPLHRKDQLDPFLLLDQMGPVDWGPGQAIGAPNHPHRGFETITYLLEGRMQHRDSGGHVGTLDPGGVQWMTAGRGAIHSELPHPEFLQSGGRMEGFQLWVNLRQSEKWLDPFYLEVAPWEVPKGEGEGYLFSLIAGDFAGLHAKVQPHTPTLYLHVVAEAGAKGVIPVPEGFQGFVFPFRGKGLFGPERTPASQGLTLAFERQGDAFHFEALEEELHFLLIAGTPLDEPMARLGPFVMNTEEEIRQAYLDFQEGRF